MAGGRVAQALRDGKVISRNHYPRIEETLAYLNEGQRKANELIVAPTRVQLPETWLLGSSGSSALKAAELGMGYSHAQFIGREPARTAFSGYREQFKPSAFMKQPQLSASFFLMVAETAEEANYHARSMELEYLLQGQSLEAVYSNEHAHQHKLTEGEAFVLAEGRKHRQFLIGTAKQVADQLRQYEADHGVDEFIFVTNIYEQQAKLKSFELLAQEILR